MTRIKIKRKNKNIIHKTNNISALSRFRLFLLYSFPFVLYFSYYPVLPLFSTASTNYELSLPLIWLFLFSALSLKDFFIYIYNIYNIYVSLKKSKLKLAPIIFLLYLSISILWSSNPLRGILTAGIAWCLYISSVVILTTFSRNQSFNKPLFFKIFLLSGVFFSLICWLQVILDFLGVSREITFLCYGCTSRIFGFPHPSGFAIEPQFMGNLLLAPTLVSLYFLFSPKKSVSPLFPKKILLLLSFILLSTLFLVFSRGAIYSFFAAFSLLLIFNLFKLKNKTFLYSLPLVALSLIFVVLFQGTFASLNKTYKTSFSCAVSTSLSQLSLGIIELPCEEEKSANLEIAEEAPEAPVYSGYVEESTDVRLSLNKSALRLASEKTLPWFFGFGLGSAGTVLYENGFTDSPKEIVQNEYLSLLLETGVIGLLLFLVLVFLFLSLVKSALDFSERFLIYSLVLAFLLSLLFFSGLPNALHLYLFPVFLLIAENKSIINQEI